MKLSERCPACGHQKVAFASKGWRHAARGVAGSRLRFCRRCGRRWVSRHRVGSRPLRRRALAWSLAVLAAASLVLAAWMERKIDQEHRRSLAASFAFRPRVKVPGRVPRGTDENLAEPGYEDADQPEEETMGPEAGGRRESDLAPSPFVVSQENDWSLARILQDLGGAMKLMRARVAGRSDIPDRDLSDSEKKDLWNRYGHLFGSKEEAKKAYEDRRNEAAEAEAEAEPEPSP